MSWSSTVSSTEDGASSSLPCACGSRSSMVAPVGISQGFFPPPCFFLAVAGCSKAPPQASNKTRVSGFFRSMLLSTRYRKVNSADAARNSAPKTSSVRGAVSGTAVFGSTCLPIRSLSASCAWRIDSENSRPPGSLKKSAVESESRRSSRSSTICATR